MAHRKLDHLIADLDDLIEGWEHVKPAHPVRALWQNHFYLDGLFNTDGGMWIVLIDGLFFIPILFAAFFYPWQALLSALVLLLASLGGLKLWLVWERNHP
jgi:hypothetical protein